MDELIGPDTVNTVPEATLDAFLDHGSSERTIDRDLATTSAVLDRLSEANIDLDDVAEKLEREGLASFAASFDEVIAALVAKAN